MHQRLAAPAGALLWSLLGAFACAAMIPLEPSLLEEGLIVHVAQRLVAGEWLYRDVASFTGPLPFELLAALFRLFGEEILVARATLVLLHAASCAVLYDFARRAGIGVLAHGAAACLASAPILLFPLYSTYFYSTLALHLATLSAWAALRGIRSPGYAALAGVGVAAVALTKQTAGVVLAPALLVALVVGVVPTQRFARARVMTLGGLAVTLAVLGVYMWLGDLDALVGSLVVTPLTLGETFETPYMNLWPIGALAPELRTTGSFYVPSLYNIVLGRPSEIGFGIVTTTQILFALPFISLLASAVAEARGRLGAAPRIHCALLLAMMSNLYPRPDWGHLVFALPFSVSQLLLLWPAIDRAAAASRTRIALASGVVVTLGASAIFAGAKLHELAEPPSYGPRVPLSPVSRATRSRGVPRAIQFLRERVSPGEPIFVARAEPLIYFATETRNPTPYSGVIPGLREEQERAIIAGLEDVRYVVMSQDDRPQFLYYTEELPAVQAHLERFFRVPDEYTRGAGRWILVLERMPDRGATLLDLIDARDQARAWIRDADGVMRRTDVSPPRLASQQNRRLLPIQLGPGGGGIDYELIVPPGARLQADIGLARAVGPDVTLKHVKRARLEVSVVSQDSVALLGTSELRRGGDRWSPVEYDLSPFAGQAVVLRLEINSDALHSAGKWGWWGSPRVVLQSRNGEATRPAPSPPQPST
jgi:4-amino-4-deoxy-L-arabinose transferase-like glycosyltransferase